MARWWKSSGLEETVLGWAVGAVLQGPDAAAAFIMYVPYPICRAYRRLPGN